MVRLRWSSPNISAFAFEARLGMVVTVMVWCFAGFMRLMQVRNGQGDLAGLIGNATLGALFATIMAFWFGKDAFKTAFLLVSTHPYQPGEQFGSRGIGPLTSRPMLS